MNKMMKDEIEEDKIDIETSFPLPTYNCTEELNERFVGRLSKGDLRQHLSVHL